MTIQGILGNMFFFLRRFEHIQLLPILTTEQLLPCRRWSWGPAEHMIRMVSERLATRLRATNP